MLLNENPSINPRYLIDFKWFYELFDKGSYVAAISLTSFNKGGFLIDIRRWYKTSEGLQPSKESLRIDDAVVENVIDVLQSYVDNKQAEEDAEIELMLENCT